MNNGRKKVLVVEDDSAQREMVELALECEGYEVETAENGEVALKLVRQGRPDLIVTDLLMPTMDGVEFLRELPLVADEVPPVLVLSGVYKRQEIRESNAKIEFLPKPYDLGEFLEKVGRLIDGPSD
jgi:two-component system cell cycle sensor histidine kinase/response regulator CckA